jgi:hypothetical protein
LNPSAILQRVGAAIGVALLGGLASAQAFITGTVTTAAGVPVQGVNIAVLNNGSGGDPTVANGGTNGSGFFFTTVTPAGVYDVEFSPPPGANSLVTTLKDVVVLGTKNLGTVTLTPGFALSGSVKTTTGLPVGNVNIDVIDSTGDNIALQGDVTDFLGNFALTVPGGAIEVRFDANNASIQPLASKAVPVTVSGPTSLGIVQLSQGHSLSGTVVKSNGQPVVGADVDVYDHATGDKLYTPGDNTDAGGTFDVLVAAGTYDLEVCPPFSQLLVAGEALNVAVSAALDLGTMVLPSGFVLSGTVKDFGGANVSNADVELLDPSTGAEVALCMDNTNSSGAYQVVVPAGTWNVEFVPPSYEVPLGVQQVSGVVVSGNKVQNGTLPSCPFSTPYGAGLAGSGGFVPALGSSGGAPRVGNSGWTWEMSNGVGGGITFLVVGYAPSALPLFGGNVLVDVVTLPYTLFTVILGGAPGAPGAGVKSTPLPVPITTSVVGITIDCQTAGIDFDAPQWISLSNGLAVTFCL